VAAKIKIDPGTLNILHCVRFSAADKQFPLGSILNHLTFTIESQCIERWKR
jgi:hypothetical protein